MKPSIQTRSGGYFDFTAPNPATVALVDIAHALSHLCRYTGHTRRFYSVAQHSVLVSEMLPPELQVWGLLHDAAEAYLGDVASPLKQLLPDYHAIEQRVEAIVWGKFGLYGDLPVEVKKADYRALVVEMRDLMSAGPRNLPEGFDADPQWPTLIFPLDPAAARAAFLGRARKLGLLAAEDAQRKRDQQFYSFV